MSDLAIGIVDREYRSGGAVDTDRRHIDFQGIPIVIENGKGSTRSGTDDSGRHWSHRMAAPYGYIEHTIGHDGGEVDIFIGPHSKSQKVFIVDQLHHETGAFDELKAFVGFKTEKQALDVYRGSYGPIYGASHTIGGVTELSVDELREWAKRGGGKWPLAPLVGAYILPHDVPKLLGNGNEQTGHEIAAQMFGQHAALGKSAVHPATVYDLGDGDLSRGHAVLEKFIDLIRKRHSAEGHAEGGPVKLSKPEVDYRQGESNRRCGLCTMYRPNSCTAVEGSIGAGMLCDLFERRK